jgi:hypothetical protein
LFNQAQVFAQQNLDAWSSLQPGEKTYEAQQAALMNFDNVSDRFLTPSTKGGQPARPRQ